MTHSTARSHPGGFSHTVTISGTAVGTDQLQVLGYFLDISTLIHYPHHTHSSNFYRLSSAFLIFQCLSMHLRLPSTALNRSSQRYCKRLKQYRKLSPFTIACDTRQHLSFFRRRPFCLFNCFFYPFVKFCNFSFHLCNYFFFANSYFFHILFFMLFC